MLGGAANPVNPSIGWFGAGQAGDPSWDGRTTSRGSCRAAHTRLDGQMWFTGHSSHLGVGALHTARPCSMSTYVNRNQ